jgi:hypothetical protein
MRIGTLVLIDLNQIDNIKTCYLWVVLLLLQIPIFFVGRKASPSPDLLIEGGKYKRPLRALEMDPDGGPILFKHWDEDTKSQLRRALYWDFLFIPLYVASVGIACLMAGRYLGGSEILRLAFLLTVPAAGFFDIVENLIMLQVIKETAGDVLVRIARVSTFCKFALIGIALFYVLVGLLSWFCVGCLRHG